MTSDEPAVQVTAANKRSERDSNPRYRRKPVCRFSKPVPSASRPSLLKVQRGAFRASVTRVTRARRRSGEHRTRTCKRLSPRRFSRPLPYHSAQLSKRSKCRRAAPRTQRLRRDCGRSLRPLSRKSAVPRPVNAVRRAAARRARALRTGPDRSASANSHQRLHPSDRIRGFRPRCR